MCCIRRRPVCHRFSQYRRRVHSCFLGDSDIHELSARFLSLIFREAHYRRCGRCDCHNSWIFFHFLHQVVTGNAGIILTTKICDYLAGLDIERQMPVPLFLVCFGELVAFPFKVRMCTTTGFTLSLTLSNALINAGISFPS